MIDPLAGSKWSVSWSTFPPDSYTSIWRATSAAIPSATNLKEFMFFSSVFVR